MEGPTAAVDGAVDSTRSRSPTPAQRPAPQNSTTRLFLVRHGETAWNAEGRIQGQLDVELNDAGRSQARRVAEELRARGVLQLADAVVSSDLARASQTADVIAALCPGAERRRDRLLREMNFGALQGQIIAADKEAKLAFSAVTSAWKDGSDLGRAFVDGESAAEVMDRGLGSLRAAAKMGPSVVVVAHGQLIKWCAIGMALADGEVMTSERVREIQRSKIANCCLSVIDYDHAAGQFIPERWFQDVAGEDAKDDTG